MELHLWLLLKIFPRDIPTKTAVACTVELLLRICPHRLLSVSSKISLYKFPLEQWFLKCGPQISNISITRKLMRNANSQAMLTQKLWDRTQKSVLIGPPWVSNTRLSLQTTSLEQVMGSLFLDLVAMRKYFLWFKTKEKICSDGENPL